MPAIASGDQNRVDICPREQLAQISRENESRLSIRFTSAIAIHRTSSIGRIAPRSYLHRGPIPMTPSWIRSLGAVVLERARTWAGTNVATAEALATDFKKVRRMDGGLGFIGMFLLEVSVKTLCSG